MAHFVFNISKGRVGELYKRVKTNDPANSAFLLIPLETSGLESDNVLIDKATVADLLSGTTNEQTTMGRKTLTDAALASFPGPDLTNDRYELMLPDVTWTTATGDPISKFVVAYDPDTLYSTDATRVPVTAFDLIYTPSGVDFKLNQGLFFRAV